MIPWRTAGRSRAPACQAPSRSAGAASPARSSPTVTRTLFHSPMGRPLSVNSPGPGPARPGSDPPFPACCGLKLARCRAAVIRRSTAAAPLRLPGPVGPIFPCPYPLSFASGPVGPPPAAAAASPARPSNTPALFHSPVGPGLSLSISWPRRAGHSGLGACLGRGDRATRGAPAPQTARRRCDRRGGPLPRPSRKGPRRRLRHRSGGDGGGGGGDIGGPRPATLSARSSTVTAAAAASAGAAVRHVGGGRGDGGRRPCPRVPGPRGGGHGAKALTAGGLPSLTSESTAAAASAAGTAAGTAAAAGMGASGPASVLRLSSQGGSHSPRVERQGT